MAEGCAVFEGGSRVHTLFLGVFIQWRGMPIGRISVMKSTWQKDLEEKVAGFRSKLETQRIQLDFDDLRLKHLIEVSESVRLYTTEYGYPLEEVAEVIGVPLPLARRLHSFLDGIDTVPVTTSDRVEFLKVFGVEKMRLLSTEYEGH